MDFCGIFCGVFEFTVSRSCDEIGYSQVKGIKQETTGKTTTLPVKGVIQAVIPIMQIQIPPRPRQEGGTQINQERYMNVKVVPRCFDPIPVFDIIGIANTHRTVRTNATTVKNVSAKNHTYPGMNPYIQVCIFS